MPRPRPNGQTQNGAKGTEFSKVVLAAGRPSPAELSRLETLDPWGVIDVGRWCG
jgi:hypothetical protein